LACQPAATGPGDSKPARPASPSPHGLRNSGSLVRRRLAQPAPRPNYGRSRLHDFPEPAAAKPALGWLKRSPCTCSTPTKRATSSPDVGLCAMWPWLGQRPGHPCVFFADQRIHGQPMPWPCEDGRWLGQVPKATPRSSPTNSPFIWKSASVFRGLPCPLFLNALTCLDAVAWENTLHLLHTTIAQR